MSYTFTKVFLDTIATDAEAAQKVLIDPTGRWGLALLDLAAAARVASAFVPRPSPLQLDRDLVRRLLEIRDGLTDWEVRFIESVSEWVKTRGELTPAQRDRAQQIDERRG